MNETYSGPTSSETTINQTRTEDRRLGRTQRIRLDSSNKRYRKIEIGQKWGISRTHPQSLRTPAPYGNRQRRPTASSCRRREKATHCDRKSTRLNSSQ